jgi:hypothetical protein
MKIGAGPFEIITGFVKIEAGLIEIIAGLVKMDAGLVKAPSRLASSSALHACITRGSHARSCM